MKKKNLNQATKIAKRLVKNRKIKQEYEHWLTALKHTVSAMWWHLKGSLKQGLMIRV